MFLRIESNENLMKLGRIGQQNILTKIHPITTSNEVAVLDCGKNPVTAIATQESKLWHIDCVIFSIPTQAFPGNRNGSFTYHGIKIPMIGSEF
jgi:hypothetical protein